MSDSTPVFTMTDTDGGSANMALYTGSLVISADSANEYTNRVLQLGVGDKAYFNLDDNGDISFREDTGTTAKFHWSAADEALGIGDTSPLAPLFVNGNETNTTDLTAVLWARSKTGASIPQMNVQGDQWQFGGGGTLDTSPTMTIDYGSNAVGIGTISPTSAIDVRGEAVFGNGTDGVKLTYSGGNSTGIIDTGFTSTGLEFRIANSEAMRLSGTNLFVGKTEANLALTGIQATSSGQAFSVTRDGGAPFALNRKSSDGEIAGFYKDTVKVGSIRSYAGTRLGIGSAGGAGFIFGGSQVYPATDGTVVNDTHDLGSASYRFKDLYLAGDIAHKDAAGNARLLYDKSENLLGNAGTYLYGFGVYLGGTGAANLLDDYEEGTFEVTAAPNTSGTVTLNVSYNTLSYTKVGRVVTINGEVRASSVSSPVGTRLVLSNLPFSVADLDDYSGRANGCTYGYISSTVVPQTFRCPEGNTQIWLDVDCSTLGSGNEFGFSFSYFTT
jgi:hypothetical protein